MKYPTCPYCGEEHFAHNPYEPFSMSGLLTCNACHRMFYYDVVVTRDYTSKTAEEYTGEEYCEVEDDVQML